MSYNRNIVLSLFLLGFIIFSGIVKAEWSEPSNKPPLGNIPGPVWLSPGVSQNGYIDLQSTNNPVININGLGESGIISSGTNYGIVGIGDLVGVRGVTNSDSGYGIFGQSQSGYAAGFDGPIIILPKSKSLKSGSQGTIYYESNDNSNNVLFCSLKGGCEKPEDWISLIFGAWKPGKNNDLYLDKKYNSVSGPKDSDFFIDSDRGLQLRFNKAVGQTGTKSVFRINNGNNDSIFELDEEGNVKVEGDLILSKDSKISLNGQTITSWDDIASGNFGTAPSAQEPQQTQLQPLLTGTLDQAYDSGGPGKGRTIIADAGAVEVKATNTNAIEGRTKGIGKSAGLFIAEGENGVGIYGEATLSGIGVYGKSMNGEIGGFFQGGDFGIGVAGEGSTGGQFTGLVTGIVTSGTQSGIEVDCSTDNCIGVKIQPSSDKAKGILVNAKGDYSAKFSGQKVLIGKDISKMSPEFITGEGDLYVNKNLEVDGFLCLGDICKNSWLGLSYWKLSDKNFLYPDQNRKVVIGKTSDFLSEAQYSLTVDNNLLVGNRLNSKDSGILINGGIETSDIQSYSNGIKTSLILNPKGGLVSIGDLSKRDLSSEDGDLYVKGNIEVDGAICFKNSGGCRNSWPSSGGSGGGSVWNGGTNGLYYNSSGVIIGPDVDPTADLDLISFDPGDLYVDRDLGINGNIYTNGDLTLGGSSLKVGSNFNILDDTLTLRGTVLSSKFDSVNNIYTTTLDTPGDLYINSFTSTKKIYANYLQVDKNLTSTFLDLMQNTTATCSDGRIRWNGTDFEGCKAGSWYSLTSTGDNDWSGAGTGNLYTTNVSDKVGIGISTPIQKLEVAGAIKIDNTTNCVDGTIRWTGTDFEGCKSNNWLSFTDLGPSPLWLDGTNGIYYNTKGIIVGPDADPTANISFTSFGANDLYVQDELGVHGNIITNGDLTVNGINLHVGTNFLVSNDMLTLRDLTLSSTYDALNNIYTTTIDTNSGDLYINSFTSTKKIYANYLQVDKNLTSTFLDLMQNTTATCSDGRIRWNGTDFEGCKAGSWYSLTSTGDNDWSGAGTGNLYTTNVNDKVGIGISTPIQKLDVAGAIKIDNTTNCVDGTIRWTGTDFEGCKGGAWVSLTSGGSGLWLDGTNGIYYNTKGVIVGPDSDPTVNIPFASFGANDLYVYDELGVNGNIISNGNLTLRGLSSNLVFDMKQVSGVYLDTTGQPLVVNANYGQPVIIGSVLDFSTNTTANCVSGRIRWNGNNFEGCDGFNWIRLDNKWKDSGVITNAIYYDTNGIIVGPDSDPTVNIPFASFGANDLYVYDELGVNGSIISNGNLTLRGLSSNLVVDMKQLSGIYLDSTGKPLVINATYGQLVYIGGSTVNTRVCINGATCTSNPLAVGYDTTNGNGAYLSPTGVWTDASSRTFKDRFESLNKQEILKKIIGLDISSWYYKGTNERHIGPVAEDFYNIFNVGSNDKYLSSLDTSGVALVGVQALFERIEELQNKVDKQEKIIQDLSERVKVLEQKIR